MTYVRSAQLRNPQLLQALLGAEPGKTMTPAKLAETVGVSRSFISQLMNGHVRSCTPQLAGKIAATLGVNIDTLFAPVVSTSKQRRRAQELTA